MRMHDNVVLCRFINEVHIFFFSPEKVIARAERIDGEKNERKKGIKKKKRRKKNLCDKDRTKTKQKKAKKRE